MFEMDVYQLVFCHITFQTDGLSLFILLVVILPFTQTSVTYPSICLVFCQLVFHHLAFLTVSHLYRYSIIHSAFYTVSFVYHAQLFRLNSTVWGSISLPSSDGLVPNFQLQVLALTDRKQYENSEFGKTLRWKYWY